MVVSLLTLVLMGWLLILFWIIASIDTQSNGLFIQERIGQFGEPFTIYKLKTVSPKSRTISRLANSCGNQKLTNCPSCGIS